MPTPIHALPSPASILLVADRSDEAEDLLDLFSHEHRSCRWLADSSSLIADMAASAPDILILARPTLMQSLACLDRLSEIQGGRPQIVLIVSESEIAAAFELVQAGRIDDYVPCRPVQRDFRRLRTTLLRMARAATIAPAAPPESDPLPAAELPWSLDSDKAPGGLDDETLLALALPKPTLVVPAVLWPIDRSGPRILVVDDDGFQFRLLKKMLSTQRLQLAWAACGEDALDSLEQVVPDLMLLDIRMPGLDGVATLTRLRARPQLAELPVVMLSGNSDRSQVVQCLQLGARGFIVKPFSKQTLLEAIGRQLGTQAISF